VKNNILFLSGDWNINFLHNSTNERELNNLFFRYNLKNTVNNPSASTPFDVIVNEKNCTKTLNSNGLRNI
jgi:hypothetical protein